MISLFLPFLPHRSLAGLLALCCGAGLLLPVPAAAAEAPKKPPPARAGVKKAEPAPYVPKPIEPLLTRDQLRACMDLQARNKAQGVEVMRLQSEVASQTDQVKRDGEALRADLATLDRTNADAVSAYNLRAANRNQQVVDFEARVADFNGRLQAFDEGRAAYLRDCENRKFDEKDEQAILKGS